MADDEKFINILDLVLGAAVTSLARFRPSEWLFVDPRPGHIGERLTRGWAPAL